MSDFSEAPAMREAATVAARGNNLVVAAPPAPVWARAVLSGLASAPRRPGPIVALAPAESVDEWARVAEIAARGTGFRIAGVHTPARIARLLRSGTVDLVILTPATAHELARRSVLKMEAVQGLLFLTPESWEEDAHLPELLQDAPREIQRIVVTGDPQGSATLIERYCWRAPLVDLLGESVAASRAVRTVTAAWRRRIEALADLVEQLDPDRLAVWTADASDRQPIEQVLAGVGATATIETAPPESGSLIIAYDLPTPGLLAALLARGEVILLLPPGTEAYASMLATERRPILLRGPHGTARAGLEADRARMMAAIAEGPTRTAYVAIAPLLERYDASAVAAALYDLWDRARSRTTAPAPAAGAAPPSKLWIGIGKRDAATPNDIVAALVKDAGVKPDAVGKVEIRESFTLVELKGGADPEAVAERLTGKAIRKRRLVARPDRGRTPAR